MFLLIIDAIHFYIDARTRSGSRQSKWRRGWEDGRDLEKGSWGETFLPNIKHHSMQMDNIKFFFNIVVVPLRLWLRTNSKIYVPVMFELYTGRKGNLPESLAKNQINIFIPFSLRGMVS